MFRTILISWISVALLAIVGCGEDNPAGADAGADADADADTDADADADGDADAGGDAGADGPETGGLAAEIRIVRQGFAGSFDAPFASADVFDGPMRLAAFAPFQVDLHEVSLAEGDCALLVAAQRACNPPCGADQYCGAGDVCKPSPQRISAGPIELTGPAAHVTLSLGDFGYDAQEFPQADFAPDVLIHAEAAGADFPAFSLEAAGVAPIDVDMPSDTNNVPLVDGKDNAITWQPDGGGTVEIVFNYGWHGAPPEATLLCAAPDEAGEIVIPRALVEAFPKTGGSGLEPHQSSITRVRRARAEISQGPVELVLAARRLVYPVHE